MAVILKITLSEHKTPCFNIHLLIKIRAWWKSDREIGFVQILPEEPGSLLELVGEVPRHSGHANVDLSNLASVACL